MKYKVLLFDADETLFDFKKSERAAFQNAMLELGVEYEENIHFKIYHDINAAIWREHEQGLITQDKLKVERFRRFLKEIHFSVDPANLANSYMQHLADASILFDDCIELIEGLHKHYRLSIITNGLTNVQEKRIRKSTVAKYFEDIVISEEIGVSKPNPRIFEHATNNLKFTDKSKILMIGDSLTSDIQGGVNFGIDTCWYNPNKAENKTSLKPNYEVKTYNELKNLLLNI